MKRKAFLFLILLACFAGIASAQSGSTTTIILLRHAEKELTGNNPSLSPAGLERSYQLPRVLGEYQPDIFWSTDYARTRQTLAPWMAATGKPLQIYNADSLATFAEQLRQMKGKTIVVAGHSNTTPQLANLLLGQEKYPQLPDTEYSKLFIITLHNGVAKDTVMRY